MNPSRVAGVGVAIALAAAACGTETVPTVEAAPAPSSTNAPSADSSQPEVEGPAPVASHLFPDLNTLDIVDGSTVNLADELAGGDTPVLLWFWAPH